MQTRVFQSGNSQAVRIPADFRFDVDVIDIFRAENGDIILRPIRKPTESFLALFEGFDDSFVNALSERDDTPPQEREEL